MWQQQPVFCANCGGCGHVYKTCNHPVISYGIICYNLFFDDKTNSIYPKYLMVQRKDSLAYVEFIRGKYELGNKQYILKLFSQMIKEEREKIQENNKDFNNIWNAMWCRESTSSESTSTNTTRNFTREYEDSKSKFDRLVKGYYLVDPESKTKTKMYFNLEYILENTQPEHSETEWGFPKGRRNINEDDINCAIREFREETSIHPKNIRINKHIKPLEEVFIGSNRIRYKHVYYIARYYPPAPVIYESQGIFLNPLVNNTRTTSSREIKDIQWFTYNEAQDKIRDGNVERKELFKRLNQIVTKILVI